MPISLSSPTSPDRWRSLRAAVYGAAGAGAAMGMLSLVSISVSPSLEYTVFLTLPGFVADASRAERGDYVTVERVSSPYLLDGKPITLAKRIACVEGDLLTTEGRISYCNGHKIAVVKERTMKGEPLDAFSYDGKITDGVFVAGTSPDSYDSRYFGLVDRECLGAILIPIW